MNERLTIRLMEGDRRLAINSVSAEGVMLRNETDATPRGLVLEFNGDSPVTKFRMDRVRQLRDWAPREFKLNISLFDGNLVVTGVDPRALPAGRYWFRLKIADLRLPGKRIQVDLLEDGEKVQDIAVKKDKRNVRLTGNINSFDVEIKRILQATASRLDSLAAAE